MQPNILFLMTDQMQGRVLDPEHPCITPNFDKLAARGVRIRNAYTTNAVCSPARASLMTGLLPHSHGVLTVTHCVHDDQCKLRTEHPHFAQRLSEAGYKTGYFGKWHVERSNELNKFGWQVVDPNPKAKAKQNSTTQISLEKYIEGPEGYRRSILYGVNDRSPDERMCGLTTMAASEFLGDALDGEEPWCCFASVIEPHDPFICGKEAFSLYNAEDIELQPNVSDDLKGRPGLYRKAARIFEHLTTREKKEAAACYYAMVTEVDQQFGRLIDQVEAAGQLDNTVIILTSDHGELLGSHGIYMKNVTGYEEVYNIPMVVAGPGIAEGQVTDARVGLHDVAPTLTELGQAEPLRNEDSRSFVPLLQNPEGESANFTQGYAEYYGTRYWFTQRIIWDGDWKLCWNGFDFDELYNLREDPFELNNRIEEPDCQNTVRKLMKQAWEIIRRTNDHSLGGSEYPVLRLAPFGPAVE
ncbi:MAG: sulfatase-like hydrolase/transferase [Planctomycetota bacterium]|nr:sulfatase-like hydrolase/transferase [Planctomycetota bacterium]MDA1139628.1 sulfatase-like hydrolase/transferase [Planctomycetota bacterium]